MGDKSSQNSSTGDQSATAKLLENYRTPLVIFIVLPLSFIFDLMWKLHVWLTKSDPRAHDTRVASVQRAVERWAKSDRSKRMCSARPGWQTLSPRHAQFKKDMHTVDLSKLNCIVEMNPSKGTVIVEPGITIGALYDYLLPRGWSLLVWPEMDELTVGGLINGYGIETSSHRFGLFADTAVRFQIVLPDGSVRWVDRENDPDLFAAIPFSFGTIGFLMAVELRMQKTKRYVKHKYVPCQTLAECERVWREALLNPECDTLEGIMFSLDRGVIMIGTYTDGNSPTEKKLPKSNFARVYRPYFYKQCEYWLDVNKEHTELIPLMEYYRRHNRSIFWALEHQVPACNHPLFRWLLGWMLPPRVQFLKLIETEAVTAAYEANYIAQDFIVPVAHFKGILQLCDKEMRTYPLWLCPAAMSRSRAHPDASVRLTAKGGDLPGQKDDFFHFVDAAVVGPPGRKGFDAPTSVRAVEQFVRDTGGFQGNYSYTYQSLEEYRSMLNPKLYDAMRAKYGGDKAFPERWIKIARQNQWTKKDANGKAKSS